MKERTLELLCIWLAAVTAAGLVPAYLISLQPAEFGHFEFGPFATYSLVFAAVFGIAGTLIYFLLAVVAPPIGRTFAVFVLLWTATTGFVFPVVQGAGMLGASDLSVNYVNLLLAALFTTVLIRLTYASRFSTLALIFFAFVVIISLAPSIPRFYELSRAAELRAKARAEFLTLSGERNVIVLSFDGLAGNIVRRVFAQRADLVEAFKDFIFFDKVLSLAPGTTLSITAELFGNRRFRDVGKTTEEVLERLDRSTLPLNRAAQNGAAAFTFGMVYNFFNLDPSRRLDTGDIQGGRRGDVLHDAATFLEYAVARTSTRHGVKAFRATGLTRRVIAALASGDRRELWARLLNHQGPRWDLAMVRQKADMQALIANVAVGRSEPYVAFMHFVHTHFPVDLDADCTYRSNDESWHLQNQSETGVLNETTCALTQAARFLDRLKALGVYEKSLLVIKSDHGKPATYYTEAPQNLIINDNLLWGVNRYRPLLLVKDFARSSPQMEVISDWVTLGDLSTTLCRELSGADDCEAFPGVNLMGDRDLRRNPIVYLDVAKDQSSTFEFHTHMTVEVDRTMSGRRFSDLLQPIEGVRLTEPPKGTTSSGSRPPLDRP